QVLDEVPDYITYYQVWLERSGVRAATAVSYTRPAAANLVTVTIDPPGSGSVTGAGSYEDGAPVSLAATPATGFTFTRWVIDGSTFSGANPLEVSAGADTSVVAEFAALPGSWAIGASAGTGGSVTGAGSYTDGDPVSLTATPDSGYTFSHWTEGGS